MEEPWHLPEAEEQAPYCNRKNQKAYAELLKWTLQKQKTAVKTLVTILKAFVNALLASFSVHSFDCHYFLVISRELSEYFIQNTHTKKPPLNESNLISWLLTTYTGYFQYSGLPNDVVVSTACNCIISKLTQGLNMLNCSALITESQTMLAHEVKLIEALR